MKKTIFISGANYIHYHSLRQLLNSFIHQVDELDYVIYIFNLGLKESQWGFLQSRPQYNRLNIVWMNYNIGACPDYYNDLQTYAFKQRCMEMVIEQETSNVTLIWMDSANFIYKPLKELVELVQDCIVYSPYSADTIARWCHPTTIRNMDAQIFSDRTMRAGGLIGIDMTQDMGKHFFHQYSMCNKQREMITPHGSNKANHRQDQSVLSCLYWRYVHKGAIKHVTDDWVCVDFHYNFFLGE